jgi:hypothetical protein
MVDADEPSKVPGADIAENDAAPESGVQEAESELRFVPSVVIRRSGPREFTPFWTL